MMIIRATRSTNIRPIAARSSAVRNFSDGKDDDKKPEEDKTEKKRILLVKKPEQSAEPESAANRLNRLLASMQTDDNLSLIKKVTTAKPSGKKNVKKTASGDRPKDIFEAAKNVAELVNEGEQKRVTESELLSKLLNHVEEGVPSGQKEKSSNGEEMSLSDLIVGMKIDRSQGQDVPTRGQYVRTAIGNRQQQLNRFGGKRNDRNTGKRPQRTEPHPNTGSVNLFGGETLGIFKDASILKESPDALPTWDFLYAQELKRSVTHPPANYFEKMILWTDQGKIWKFPINNEQGLDEEANVDFSEHIFLDQHLEGWCPTRGPVRHFMELVCVGLSKNPYISAQEKKDHILWYKDYFEQKKDMLKDLIVDAKETKQLQK